MTRGSPHRLACPACRDVVTGAPVLGFGAFACPSCGARLRIQRSKTIAVIGFVILFSLIRIAGDTALGWGAVAVVAIIVLVWEHFGRKLILARTQ